MKQLQKLQQKMMEMQRKGMAKVNGIVQRAADCIENNKGVGIVEIALIIVVIVALVVIFKDKVTALLTEIFDKINVDKIFIISIN